MVHSLGLPCLGNFNHDFVKFFDESYVVEYLPRVELQIEHPREGGYVEESAQLLLQGLDAFSVLINHQHYWSHFRHILNAHRRPYY